MDCKYRTWGNEKRRKIQMFVYHIQPEKLSWEKGSKPEISAFSTRHNARTANHNVLFYMMSKHHQQAYLRTWTAVTVPGASIWFHDAGKTLTSDSTMLLSETKVLPRWQCFRQTGIQWECLYQEQILFCSKTHSQPNKAEKAVCNCFLLYLWLPM